MQFKAFLLCVLLIGARASVVRADEAEDRREFEQQRERDDERVSERTISFDREDNDRYEFELKSGIDSLECELRTETNKEARLEVEYEREQNNTENSVELRSRYYRIVEFNTTDKFDNTTTVCSQYLIGTDAPWKNIVRVNSGDTISLTGETNDDRFALVAKLVPRPLTQGNETLSPNSIKVDIIIKNYAYQCANSKLALEVRLRTERETTQANGVEVETEIVGQLAAAYFSWLPTINADGTDVPVLTSELQIVGDDEDTGGVAQEVERRVYFTFDTTDQISTFTWDPELGITYPSVGSSSSSLSGGAIAGIVIGVMVVVAGVVFLVVQRRRNSSAPSGSAPPNTSSMQMA